MADFTCESCGFAKTVNDSLVGKRGKCPRCSVTSPVLPSMPVQAVHVVEVEPTAVAGKHPAKKAMIIATVAWPVVTLVVFVLLALLNYSMGDKYGNGVLDPVTERMVSYGQWTFKSVFFAAFESAFFCTPIYLLSLLICFVAYFASNNR